MRNKEDILRQIFITYQRRALKNEWIQIAKKDVDLFDDLAKILVEKEMDFHDYVDYHFTHSKHMSAKYITSPNAINRYDYHRKLKNIYAAADYSIDGDDFYVNSTHKRYDMSQVKEPISQDQDANYALTMSETDCKLTRELYEVTMYTLCKFSYKRKAAPISLVKLRERFSESEIHE